MSQHPDLSLPTRAPSMARYHDQPMTLHPAALYTLVDLTDAEFQALQDECESGCLETGHERGTSVRPAPQSRFVGQPLRAVFDYHVGLGAQDTFEPRYFIAAVEKDWRVKGVILVTLDDDDLECKVDKFRINAVDSGLSIVNLQIGNSSWDEEKEGYELQPDDDDDNGDEDNDTDDDGNDGDGPPAPIKNIPLGYYVPIYIHASLSEDQVIANLEPAFKQKSPENFACRVQARLTPGTSAPETTPTQDLIQQAAALHPQRCKKNKYLHKTHILVIDTDDPVENGMLMVKLPSWHESHSEATEKPALNDIGSQLAEATLQNIRIPYSCHDGLQTRFLILANGDAEWPSEAVRAQPLFVVFQYNTQSKELGFGATSIDPDASKRKPGEERVVYVPSLIKQPGRGLERIAWNYDEAVRRFPWFCREKRFVEGLDKRFFACVDGNDVVQTGLLLVHRSWDENVWNRTRDELLDLPVEGVKNVRVPIKQALDILEKGRQGETDGMSESLKEFFS
ncbi:hypothetical protein PFICI_06874 [Pestalotiopsis fici W106-1]|uniref:Uncharacterized protein n=1 Tax=Pestalotiopsis fici (strain W106-1 / CGMCC3.15140) TaxID=1229662 RepID=W3X903_PESFW|nr:uncharacterized protein PFICI_06874 [Pestalotiopsis fici W106-1]ETS81872.1 hypothetical protein PFICI_06874 [Pestalotiopsis fici W106-1]